MMMSIPPRRRRFSRDTLNSEGSTGLEEFGESKTRGIAGRASGYRRVWIENLWQHLCSTRWDSIVARKSVLSACGRSCIVGNSAALKAGARQKHATLRRLKYQKVTAATNGMCRCPPAWWGKLPATTLLKRARNIRREPRCELGDQGPNGRRLWDIDLYKRLRSRQSKLEFQSLSAPGLERNAFQEVNLGATQSTKCTLDSIYATGSMG